MCKYPDPDDFLHMLFLFMRRRITGGTAQHRSLQLDADFKPEILDCNLGKYPNNVDAGEEVSSSSHLLDKALTPREQ